MQPEDHLYASDEWWMPAFHSYVGGKSKDEMGGSLIPAANIKHEAANLEIDLNILNTKISIITSMAMHLAAFKPNQYTTSITIRGPNTSTIIRGSLAKDSWSLSNRKGG